MSVQNTDITPMQVACLQALIVCGGITTYDTLAVVGDARAVNGLIARGCVESFHLAISEGSLRMVRVTGVGLAELAITTSDDEGRVIVRLSMEDMPTAARLEQAQRIAAGVTEHGT